MGNKWEYNVGINAIIVQFFLFVEMSVMRFPSTGDVIKQVYAPVLITVGIVGNLLSFLVRMTHTAPTLPDL